MELADLVRALLSGDALSARQWVQDAHREQFAWSTVEEPLGLTDEGRAVAAGVVEMMAERAGVVPPSWTADVPAAPAPIALVKSAETMPRLRRMCEIDGPAPLRRRRILAPPEFLTFA